MSNDKLLDEKLQKLYSMPKTPERDDLISEGEELWGKDPTAPECRFWSFNYETYLDKINSPFKDHPINNGGKENITIE